MRRIITSTLAGLVGLLMIVDGFAPGFGLGRLRGILVEGAVILGGFALLAGVLNLTVWHLRRLREGAGAASQSLLLLLALLGTASLLIVVPNGTAPQWIYAYLYEPVQASLMALLAFYSVSAAFRAFALRTLDAVLLMISAIAFLLLQLPFASTAWAPLALVRIWLLEAPIAAIMRGIAIGAALGAMTASLRLITGQDRPQVGE